MTDRSAPDSPSGQAEASPAAVRQRRSEPLSAAERRALESAGVGLCRTDLDGVVLALDRATLAAVDLLDRFPDPAALVGTSVFDHATPYLQHWQEAVRRFRSGAAGNFEPSRYQEVQVETVRGAVRWILYDAFYVAGDGDEAPSVQFVVRDITQYKQAEDALAQHRALLEATMESLPFDLFALDRQGRYILQNSASRRQWGNLVGKRPEDVETDPRTLALWLDNNARALAGSLVQGEEELLVDGERRIVFNVVGPIRDRGTITGVLGINVDITEQRRVEQRFRELHDNVPVGVFRIKAPRAWESVNPAGLRILGYRSAEELTRTEPKELFVDPAVGDAIREELAARGFVEDCEAQLHRRDGSAIWVSLSITAVPGRDGEVDHYDGIFQDVTVGKRMGERLRHAAKMEAVGRLAGGIAHDFNNLLTGILGHASMLRRRRPPDDGIDRSARAIEQAAERAHELTDQLLGFARKGKYRREAVDVHRTVREVLDLVAHTFFAGVEPVLDLAAERATVMGDPGQLHQVLLNLVLNANEAMPAGGTVTVRTRNVAASTPPMRLRPWPAAGFPSAPPLATELLEITVEDTGSGIPASTRPRIFEPFFTTKEGKGGAGMGLAMAYGIVDRHHGTLEALDAPGAGALLRIRLPLAAAPDSGGQGEPGEATDPPASRRPEVLVADDEPLVRSTVCAMLEALDYPVREAEGGRRAVEIFREHHRHIGLVLLDLVMPEMNGRQCAAELRAIAPGVRILLTTGHDLDHDARAALAGGTVGLIRKPYTYDKLREVLRQALSGDR